MSGYSLSSIYDFFPNEEYLVASLIERQAEKMVAVVESRRPGCCSSVLRPVLVPYNGLITHLCTSLFLAVRVTT